ncbi:MAG: thioredoxin family protein [Aurantibacter sp.]
MRPYKLSLPKSKVEGRMSENRIDSKSTEELIQVGLSRALSYQDYRSMVSRLALEGKSTGKEQTETLTNYTLLNDRRMKRFDKTLKVNEEMTVEISNIEQKITFLVLTESWCGDAAPTMPVMNKIAELNENIDLKVILRDENLELMNRFLYNDTLSIPRLLMIDSESKEVLGDWGPRPSEATKMAEEYKAQHGTLSPEFKEDLQIWYNKDTGQNTLEDLAGLLLENVSNGSLL